MLTFGVSRVDHTAARSYEDSNLLLILVCKLFKRMVMDAFVYHKYCKSHFCTVALTLQLEHYFSGLCQCYLKITQDWLPLQQMVIFQ
jgi:hypothetical protein